jgi:hypothetical protein
LSSASRYSTVLFEWDTMAMMIFPDTWANIMAVKSGAVATSRSFIWKELD